MYSVCLDLQTIGFDGITEFSRPIQLPSIKQDENGEFFADTSVHSATFKQDMNAGGGVLDPNAEQMSQLYQSLSERDRETGYACSDRL